MKKILGYPFSKEIISITRILVERNNMEEIIMSVPRGWIYIEDNQLVDAGDAIWGEKIGCYVTNGFEEYLEQVNTVIFFDSKKRDLLLDDYYKKIKASVKKKKDIICCISLEEDKRKEIDYLCRISGTRIIYKDNPNVDLSNTIEKIYKLEVPVIGVGNLFGEFEYNCDALILGEKMRKLGYRVAVITHNRSALIIDDVPTYVVPSWNAYDERVILKINGIAKRMEQCFFADVILVDIPGTMMRYSREIYNNFELDAFCYSQAFEFDYFVLNSIAGNFNKQFYMNLSKLFEKKYGFEIDKICVTNNCFAVAETEETKDIVCNKLPCQLIDEYIKGIETDEELNQILNGCKKETYSIIVGDIVNSLST